ncbi:MAG: GNAT family N-acetyltransferase [Tannerellaceae bacterium]
MIRFKRLEKDDLSFVKQLYDYYITNSTVIFHLEPLTLEELEESIPINDDKYYSALILYNQLPIGFCYLSKFKPKKAFDITVEVTVYIKPDFQGKGIGQQTLQMIYQEALCSGFKNMVALITADNTPSIRLFEKNGYEKCAHIKHVAQKFDKMLDLTIYQKLIE